MVEQTGCTQKTKVHIVNLLFIGIFAVAGFFTLFADNRSLAQEVSVSGCECELVPGDDLEVSLSFSNSSPESANLLAAIKIPGSDWRFFSPGGIIDAPTWMPIPAGIGETSLTLLSAVLHEESLPFGHVPLVGPFRYEFIAALYDETGVLAAPPSFSYFDFSPRPLPPPLPTEEGELHLVVHHHNDLAWLENEDVNLALGADFLFKAVTRAAENPDFRFAIDQKPVLEAFVTTYPDLVDDLQNLIDTSRCELAGGFLVEPDLNMVSGEFLARQVILGQRYLEERWGKRSRVGWNIDSFGHSLQIPQIAAKGGMEYYVFSRGDSGDFSDNANEFHWGTSSGFGVTAHRTPYNYQIAREIGLTSESDDELSELFALMGKRSTARTFLALAGADANEGLFNGFVPEAVARWNGLQREGVAASALSSTATDFFTSMLESGEPIGPIVHDREFVDKASGESIHGTGGVLPGTYGSRIEVKKENSRLEHLQLDAEKIATFASFSGFHYPEEELGETTELIALNQTHDYIGGCGVDAIYEDEDSEINDFGDRKQLINEKLNTIVNDAGTFISSRVDTRFPEGELLNAFVVFNTLSWDRKELVTVPAGIAEISFPARLVNQSGVEITYQRFSDENGDAVIGFMAEVPAMGYATYRLVDGEPQAVTEEQFSYLPYGLDTEWNGFRLRLDGKGFLRELVSLATGREFLNSSAAGGDMWWADELYGNAYEFDSLGANRGQLSQKVDAAYLLSGPVMDRVVSFSYLTDLSMVVREIRIPHHGEKIDFRTTVYWADVNKNLFLNLQFPYLGNRNPVQGVPYGFIERHLGWYPVLRWSEYGDEFGGIAILNRGIFGHNHSLVTESNSQYPEGNDSVIKGMSVDIVLLRSLDRAVFGDRSSETMKEHGGHRYDWALVPHDGSWQDNHIPQMGWAYNSPMHVFYTGEHDGELPASKTYVQVEPEHGVILSALYKEGANLVLRLIESEGVGKEVSLSFPDLQVKSAVVTDLLGDPIDIYPDFTALDTDLRAQSITTVRVEF